MLKMFQYFFSSCRSRVVLGIDRRKHPTETHDKFKDSIGKKDIFVESCQKAFRNLKGIMMMLFPIITGVINTELM